MHASAFAKELGRGYGFGIDKTKSIEALRRLADDIENGRIILQSALEYSKADNQDFTLSALVLKFAEKLPEAGEVKLLYGSEQFPVAKARVGS